MPPKPEGTHTVAVQRRALSLEEALAHIRGNDPRPLLVLRECVRCSGTEDAMLSRMADNERTFLLSRWFHCVKLPPAVLEPDHPFHNLFPGEKPAHLFVSRADGSLRHDLVGIYSQVELWGSMKAVLASEYREDPDHALGKLSRILDKFDELDERILALERRIDLVIETDGPKARELAGLRRDMLDLCAKRNELREDAVRASKLTPIQLESPARKAG